MGNQRQDSSVELDVSKVTHETAYVLLSRLRELWSLDDTANANVKALMLAVNLDVSDENMALASLHWLEAEIYWLVDQGHIESWYIKGDIYGQRITQIDDPYNKILMFKSPPSFSRVRGCCG